MVGCKGIMNLVVNYGIYLIASISSEHNVGSLVMSTKAEKGKKPPKKHMSWLKLADPLIQDVFSKE